MYSKWLNLQQGMTVVDVGCGLGYMGWTYWKYFGKGGRYFGLDQSSCLIEEAVGLSNEWVHGGIASFQQGDAYELPYPDNFADWTVCQTLLMHLEFPEKALEEMVRVTKSGGLVMCNEPDNVSSSLKTTYPPIELCDDDYLVQHHRVMLIWARGRKKLGYGDYSVAVKIPWMMHNLGLVEIDSRCNDKCNFIQPPYETPDQKYQLELAEEALSEEEEDRNKNRRRGRKEFRKFYLAGGGSLSSYYRFMRKADRVGEEYRDVLEETVKSGKWRRSWGGSSFFCIKGRKPEKQGES
jgi:ubiquinone/menaquinone biosynthesis C-methylase UbiE